MSTRNAKVFIVQLPMMWNTEKTQKVPKFDFKKAQEHGDLVFLLTPNANPFKLEPILAELRHSLSDYRFDDGDSLILVGNPVLMGVVAAIAADLSQGDLRFLQWGNKDEGCYNVVEAFNVFGY